MIILTALCAAGCTGHVSKNMIRTDDTPVIECDSITVTKGADFRYQNYCRVTEAKGLVHLYQSAPVDTSTAGKKKLALSAVDASGNITVKTFDVNVVENTPAPDVETEKKTGEAEKSSEDGQKTNTEAEAEKPAQKDKAADKAES